jgi:PAS domain S-box-containing protein
VNNALCGMLGFSEQELCGVDFRSLFPKTGPGQATEKFTHLLHGDIRSFGAESGFQTKRKEIVWGHFTTSLLRDTENNPSAFLQMVESIDERKKSQEQLLGYQQQLQSLTSELSLSEERERRRIATNLHDRIGQTLAFARLKLGTLAQASNSKALEEVRELIEEAIGDTRSLTFELSPPVLYELGLVAAVEWLARKIQQEHSILTRFHDDGQPKPLDEDFRVVLFQAVRELLVNVVKHARASHAQVLMRRDADALRIIIEDDGAGFDEAKLNIARDSARSFGLFNIRERLEYLGGRLKIRSEIGRGTRVTLFAPLKLAQNATTEVKP